MTDLICPLCKWKDVVHKRGLRKAALEDAAKNRQELREYLDLLDQVEAEHEAECRLAGI